MSNVRKNKRDPREKEIPDQSNVSVGVAIDHTRGNQCDTYCTGSIKQGKDSNVMAVADEEISKSVYHNDLEGVSHSGSALQRTQDIDEINIAGRVTKICEQDRGFTAVLCPVVDEVEHRLPEDSFVR